MTHYRALREDQGDWLGQWDLPEGRDVVVVIEKVERYVPARRTKRKLPDGRYVEEKSKRLIVSFRGKRKRWLSGPVTQETIAGMYGPKIEGWLNKPISLYVDPDVMMSKKTTGGVRVRPTPPRIGTPPTTDPLDRPVDEEKAKAMAEAREALDHDR